jgi:hypothetical protein
LSAEALAEQAARGELDPPEHTTLPWTYWRRGRGALVAVAGWGLSCFFMPWVELITPHSAVLTGYDLARAQSGWLWGGALGFFLLVPLTLSRRSVWALRGVRAICAAFAVMTLGEVLMMLSMPPAQHPLMPVEFEYRWGLYLSGAASLLATLIALRLGGSPADLRDLRPSTETSEGNPVH